MISLNFFVPGTPRAKQSFRYKSGGSYQSEGVKTWQGIVQHYAGQAYKDEIQTCKLTVVLNFHVKSDIADVDNLAKAVMDGLQGMIFKNDRQVNRLIITKKVVPADHTGVWIKIKNSKIVY